MTDQQTPPDVSKLPLVIMGAVVVMAVLLTIVLVVTRGPVEYDEGTPEAALQDFVDAALDEDADALLDLVTPRMQSRCFDALDRRPGRWYVDDLRAELDEIEIIDDRAEATVTFRHSSLDDPFDSSSWSFDEFFTLARIDGVWLIDEASWPGHSLFECSQLET